MAATLKPTDRAIGNVAVVSEPKKLSGLALYSRFVSSRDGDAIIGEANDPRPSLVQSAVQSHTVVSPLSMS